MQATPLEVECAARALVGDLHADAVSACLLDVNRVDEALARPAPSQGTCRWPPRATPGPRPSAGTAVLSPPGSQDSKSWQATPSAKSSSWIVPGMMWSFP